MKRSITFILALCMILALTACKESDPEDPNLAAKPSTSPTAGSSDETQGTTAPPLNETAPTQEEPAKTQPTDPPATDPTTTPPEPQATEPVAAEPPATEPPAAEPPATERPITGEVIPGDPNRVYHTEWGTRPYEFEEVRRDVVDETFMFVMHWDRYGNVWWDHEDTMTTGHGKSIWQTFVQMPSVPAYFGYGRWSNFKVCWDEDGFSGGYTNWSWGGDYLYPSFWGSEYEPMYSPCPSDAKVWALISSAGHYLGALEKGDEVAKVMQQELGLTDEQVEMILQDPTTFPIPDSGYYG